MHSLELNIVSATLPKKQNNIAAVDALNSYISFKQMGFLAKLQNKNVDHHYYISPTAETKCKANVEPEKYRIKHTYIHKRSQ